ncbi:hypothetical protein Tco_1148089, partial [Tanacetum coccineum]
VISKVGDTNALPKPATLNSVPKSQESTVVKVDNVIAPGMFRINPSKTSRVENVMPNKPVKASVRTKLITTSQPHAIHKEIMNSNSNGLSSTGIDNTTKTRRPHPRSKIKNDRVPIASKSSCIKNKEVHVEAHHRNLLLSKNKEHMSSECNNIKLAIQNDKYEVVCAMCKQCLITANHNVYMLSYVNGMNSCVHNQRANVSNNASHKKHRATVMNINKIWSKERLVSPKPSKPRTYLSSKGENAYTSNPHEPTSKQFPNSTFSLAGRLNLFMVRRLGLLKAYDRKSEAINKLCLEVLKNRLLWKRSCCCNFRLYFVIQILRSLSKGTPVLDWGVLLKGNRTTNLYTIILHEMASASPICLMARATSTKSWFWHQRQSQLNFDTINDLAKNDLVTGLPKLEL